MRDRGVQEAHDRQVQELRQAIEEAVLTCFEEGDSLMSFGIVLIVGSAENTKVETDKEGGVSYSTDSPKVFACFEPWEHAVHIATEGLDLAKRETKTHMN